MYKPGELQIAPDCRRDSVARRDVDNDLDDGLCYEHSHPEDLYGGVFLPHSCDQWVIGGPDAIRALIRDLETALTKLTMEGGKRE